MFWPQPDSIESDDTLMLSPEPLIPCWPNDRWPGPGCPGMIISHIRLSVSERPLSVRGGGQVPWLISASGPGLGTSSWDFHIPALAASSPALSGVLWTVWTLRYSRHCHTRFTSVLKNSPPLHPLCRPGVDVDNDYLSFIYFSRSEAECKHPSEPGLVAERLGAGAGGWTGHTLLATGAAPGPEPGLLAVDGGPWSLVLALASQPGTSSPGLMINTKLINSHN